MAYATVRLARHPAATVQRRRSSELSPRRVRRLLALSAVFLILAAARLLGLGTVPTTTVDTDRLEQDMHAVLGLIVADVEDAARRGSPPARLPVAALAGTGTIEYRILGPGRYRIVLHDPYRSVEFDARVPAVAPAGGRAGGQR